MRISRDAPSRVPSIHHGNCYVTTRTCYGAVPTESACLLPNLGGRGENEATERTAQTISNFYGTHFRLSE